MVHTARASAIEGPVGTRRAIPPGRVRHCTPIERGGDQGGTSAPDGRVRAVHSPAGELSTVVFVTQGAYAMRKVIRFLLFMSCQICGGSGTYNGQQCQTCSGSGNQ